ncbi:hypothetical protein GCM10027275_17960 [Rhabdobacter roseus]
MIGLALCTFWGCQHSNEPESTTADSLAKADSLAASARPAPGRPSPEEVVAFAKTLRGVPYRFATCDPKKGFDCSGFIAYVFNHFGMEVPRSSAAFARLGREVPRQQARPGDLILFTGTVSAVRRVGHIGMVVENQDGELSFIHATSGREMAVTITPLTVGYKRRFVKVIRLL